MFSTLRMRVVLIVLLVSASIGLTAVSLLLVHVVVQNQIRTTLSSDLTRSVETFRKLNEQRQQTLESEARLLADLPDLRALMTTQDARTIQDAGTEFWQVSGSRFFALLGTHADLIANYTRGEPLDRTKLSAQLRDCVLQQESICFLFTGSQLMEVALQPLYFNPSQQDSLLGYLAVGDPVDQRVAREVSAVTSAEVLFAVNGVPAASTLRRTELSRLTTNAPLLLISTLQQQDVKLGRENFLASSVRISPSKAFDVQMIVLKSLDQASVILARLNRILLSLGALLVVVEIVLVLLISRQVTFPLEQLVAGVRALGEGDFKYGLDVKGTLEIGVLRSAFLAMREKLQTTQQTLLENERLATIGRMARSVSHDLRHYLSTIYANAEFLSTPTSGSCDRTELFQEIRTAVFGMTELLDSLVIFSRTGKTFQPAAEHLISIVERAVILVRSHPDARDVAIVIENDSDLMAFVDSKMLVRAIYNLVLNGCQSAARGQNPQVVVQLFQADEKTIAVDIEDNGPGVPQSVSSQLFQPFVSEGKSNGTGLGLTLAQHILQEHGGDVLLIESTPRKTVFRVCLPSGTGTQNLANTQVPEQTQLA